MFQWSDKDYISSQGSRWSKWSSNTKRTSHSNTDRHLYCGIFMNAWPYNWNSGQNGFYVQSCVVHYLEDTATSSLFHIPVSIRHNGYNQIGDSKLSTMSTPPIDVIATEWCCASLPGQQRHSTIYHLTHLGKLKSTTFKSLIEVFLKISQLKSFATKSHTCQRC